MVEFGTAGIRGDVTDRVSPQVALGVGRAVASMSSDVVLGRDGRTSSPGLADAMAAGLVSGGADVDDVGAVPTAAVAAASRGRYGVMITASHNPPLDNGIKLFRNGSEFNRENERTVEQLVAEELSPVRWSEWGRRRQTNVISEYRSEVSAYLSNHGSQAAELSVAVDCGHGMGGYATPAVLDTIGARVTALNAVPDGHFPGRASKPTPDSLASFGHFVGRSDVDLGIAHDGDADRVVILDANGEIVHEDTILAILGHHYVSQSDVTDPVVVTTPNASDRVDEQVVAAGGRVVRTALGALHEGIANVDETDGTRVVFAGEPWKHIHPSLGRWIDGVVSAGLVVRLVATAGSIDVLREPVSERPYRKTSINCPDRHKRQAMKSIRKAVEQEYPEGTIDTSHGMRLTWPDDGWVLVRPSGTEPKIRIYLEADDIERRLDAITDIVSAAIEPEDRP